MPRKKRKFYQRKPFILALTLVCIAAIAGCIALAWNNANLQNRITDAEAAVNTLQAELHTNQGQLDAVTALQKQTDETVVSLRADLSRLQTEKAAIQAEKDSLALQYEEMKTDYAVLQKKVNGKVPTPVTGEKVAYLTFDDGPSKYTTQILDILAKYNVKATFFPNGEGSNSLYKAILDAGHAIGNHTDTHEWKTVYGSLETFQKEVNDLQTKIADATGGYTPKIFRFPGGSNNTVHKKYNTEIMPLAIEWINSQGFVYFDWNVDSDDAGKNAPLPSETIVKNVVNGATGNRAIILMHDTGAKKTTVDALEDIIVGLRDKGYAFAVLDETVAPYQFRKS